MHVAFRQRDLRGAGVDNAGMAGAILIGGGAGFGGSRNGLRHLFNAIGGCGMMFVRRGQRGLPFVAPLFRRGKPRKQQKRKGQRRNQFGHIILRLIGREKLRPSLIHGPGGNYIKKPPEL